MNLLPTDRIPHLEHFSNPRFEAFVTGIDPWAHPQRARQRFLELLPIDVGAAPTSDAPIERVPDEALSIEEADGTRVARWGTGKSWHWDWGRRFPDIDTVLAYDPTLEVDLRGAGLVADLDYRLGVDELACQFQRELDEARAVTGDRALVVPSFYNTLFMWPLLTFGWRHFLRLGARHRTETRRILAGFAERSRKVFQAWAKTDVEVFCSHDDICHQAGPSFSPAWLREEIYPYYEEFWGYLRDAGARVILICDGNLDQVADDIFACGADGLMSEPYTDWDRIARDHPDKIIMGDGDSRVLASNDPVAIERMVERMAALGRRQPGYFFCIGNHLPWDLPVSAIASYFAATENHGAASGAKRAAL